MKKIIATLFFLCVFASVTFGQTTADEWFKKAGEYFNNGDYTNAITAYSESLKRDRSNLDAYWFRSVAYFQVKNYDAAIADCDTVIKGAPDFSTVYIARGDAYGAKGIYHKAVADFKTGLEKGYDPSGFNVDKSSNADMWFCGAMYMEIVINRFLGKSDVVTKYENWLKTVCDKNNVTRTEVEKFYRDNVRTLIAAVVDEEFRGVDVPTQRVTYVKQILTDFYLTSNQTNFNTLKDYYSNLTSSRSLSGSNNVEQLADELSNLIEAGMIKLCLDKVLVNINTELASRVKQ